MINDSGESIIGLPRMENESLGVPLKFQTCTEFTLTGFWLTADGR